MGTGVQVAEPPLLARRLFSQVAKRNGAQVDAQWQDGRAALHGALGRACLSAAAALSAAGASWVVVDRFGPFPVDLLDPTVFTVEKLRRIQSLSYRTL